MLLPPHPIRSLAEYRQQGGLQGLARAQRLEPAALTDVLRRAGLRGRGGAGFPTHRKWDAVRHAACPTRYVVANGAEGEPATFKDRLLMRRNPYQLLEGLLIAGRAVNAERVFLALKESFAVEYQTVIAARDEMIAAGFLQPGYFEIVRGPEDYLFGEEKAMLEVIEGKDALPRVAERPPYQYGLFVEEPDKTNPTVVNNVETISNLPVIFSLGATAYANTGAAASPGTMLFTVCGDVRRPGVYELPLGTPLSELLEIHAGGPRRGRRFKAVFSGVANAVILPDRFQTPLEFDAMRAAGSGLGAGGFYVCDDSTCMLQVAWVFSEFLYRSSCTQCISCKYGAGYATQALRRLVRGIGTDHDMLDILSGAKTAPHANRCYLPVQFSILIPSILHAFHAEFVDHFGRGCSRCRLAQLPLITDYDPVRSTFTYGSGSIPKASSVVAIPPPTPPKTPPPPTRRAHRPRSESTRHNL